MTIICSIICRSLYDVRMNLDVLKCCSTVLFLVIPIIGSGDDATYAIEIYLKEASGNIRKKDFSKADVAELEFMFFRGDMVDAFFSVELYNYKNNAGIRLVAKKLVVHCR
ncbi:Os10g0407400 [Oryza sativa Japonica Group]|uniref:Os10g0407400 protein n=1 Tax=Oryza sativa subsp. japonica TaxID=39947 RepID=C7J7L0_ORYSJ|nr:Os10g0407400 [Oryza sativa Japonica Group]|eukprot:NP_001176143.1 Os10g0407400 [Oryza sativa Japonica Group]